jgi:hypothetical protein
LLVVIYCLNCHQLLWGEIMISKARGIFNDLKKTNMAIIYIMPIRTFSELMRIIF